MSPRPIELPVEGLTDGTVRLRLPADTDVARIVEACRDEEISRYTTVPADYKEHHALDWMRRGMAGLATGSDLHTVITDAESGDVLGTSSLHEINRATGRCAAGYLVAPWARGHGIATLSLRLLCGFAFDALHLGRVELAIEPQNAASQAAARNAGFAREGLLRSYLPISGARRDMEMWSLLPGEITPPSDRGVATLEE